MRAKPVCSKGDNRACFKSVSRVRAALKREYLEEHATRAALTSAGPISPRTLNSADLHSDGVIAGEINSHNSNSDVNAFTSRRYSK